MIVRAVIGRALALGPEANAATAHADARTDARGVAGQRRSHRESEPRAALAAPHAGPLLVARLRDRARCTGFDSDARAGRARIRPARVRPARASESNPE